MIDSKQDEAVKLEARRLLAAEMADADAAVLVSPGGLYDLDCRVPAEEALRAVVNALTRTTPANLNAPDKQEALSGEGVERGNLLLDWYNAQANVVWAAWCAADDSSDDFNPETHVAVPNDSFGDLAAALEALDALVPADSQNVGTGALNDEVRAVLSRTPSSPQADEADVERDMTLPELLNELADYLQAEDRAGLFGHRAETCRRAAAALTKPAALPKGEDLEQLILDARVAASGTRLTCREREVIRALCDALAARAALAPPPQAHVE